MMFSPNSAYTISFTPSFIHIQIQLSYASASSSLSDRTRFPNFWRTYPSNDNLAQSIVAVVMHYGWMQLKIITQDESLFTSVSLCLLSVYHGYSNMPYVGMTLVATLKVHKLHARNVYVRLVKGPQVQHLALFSAP